MVHVGTYRGKELNVSLNARLNDLQYQLVLVGATRSMIPPRSQLGEPHSEVLVIHAAQFPDVSRVVGRLQGLAHRATVKVNHMHSATLVHTPIVEQPSSSCRAAA